jgi:hypothetical protein
MATPHVAGAVALLWSAQPSLRHDIDRTEALLNETAVHISSTSCSSPQASPNNVFGYGRLDIKAAVDAALLQVLNITNDGTAVTLTFYGVQGRIYRLERRDDLTPNTSWQSINGVNDVTASTTGPTQVVDPLGGSNPREFYRMRILLP